MKKFLVAAVLIYSTTAFAQTSATPPAQGTTAPAQQKTIKDPAEYNAYISATQLTDPTQKAAALEGFVQTYPNSVVKEDALAAAMGAYQQANNMAKSIATANAILQINPNNVPACVVVVYGTRQQAVQTNNPQLALQAGQKAVSCLPFLDSYKPDGVEPAALAKQKAVFGSILNNAAGSMYLQTKDYENARKYFTAAITANPASVDDTYNLALAYTSPRPLTDDAMLNGLWYLARALNMVAGNAAAEKQIGDYGKSIYRRYHGADDGWDQFIAQVKAANTPMPPADLA